LLGPKDSQRGIIDSLAERRVLRGSQPDRLTIASAGADVLEMIMSPPAVRKSIARLAGGMLATATVSPRSSETMTPLNPMEPRNIWVMTTGEKAARWSGSIRVYLARATMTKSVPRRFPVGRTGDRDPTPSSSYPSRS